jgi:hypothetical protein
MRLLLTLLLTLALSVPTSARAAHTPIGTPTHGPTDSAVIVAAEPASATSDTTITEQVRTAVIDSVLSSLTEDYIFPEKAKEAAAVVRENVKRGAYEDITDGRAFGDTLTAHINNIINDRHFRVAFRLESEDRKASGGEKTEEQSMKNELSEERRENFGFNKVEHLEGNVGYIDLNSFSHFKSARQTAAAAMAFVENTDALIIDLRRNGGGGRVVIDFLSSYLLGPDPVHLTSIYNGIQDYTEEFWTQAELPGKRYGTEKPLYILTSKRTFSAAEEFSYNLKHLDRAVIVGEQTGGGAHPITVRRLTDKFVLRLPIARAINPVTGTNWEGTGVQPDRDVAAGEALETAHLEALKSIRRTSSGDKNEIRKLIEKLEDKRGPQEESR